MRRKWRSAGPHSGQDQHIPDWIQCSMTRSARYGLPGQPKCHWAPPKPPPLLSTALPGQPEPTLTPNRSMSFTVMSTYGWLTSSSLILMSIPSAADTKIHKQAGRRQAVQLFARKRPAPMSCAHRSARRGCAGCFAQGRCTCAWQAAGSSLAVPAGAVWLHVINLKPSRLLSFAFRIISHCHQNVHAYHSRAEQNCGKPVAAAASSPTSKTVPQAAAAAASPPGRQDHAPKQQQHFCQGQHT